MTKETLFGKTLSELQTIVLDLGLPKFTAGQIADWLYKKDITSIDEMSNLAKSSRQVLNENFEFGLTPSSKVQESVDGNKKYLFPCGQHKIIEAAYIPNENEKPFVFLPGGK